jgi:hypothetical protein
VQDCSRQGSVDLMAEASSAAGGESSTSSISSSSSSSGNSCNSSGSSGAGLEASTPQTVMQEIHEMLEHTGCEGAGEGGLEAAGQLHLPPLGPPEREVEQHEEISLVGKISAVVEGIVVVTVRTISCIVDDQPIQKEDTLCWCSSYCDTVNVAALLIYSQTHK